MYDVFFGFFVCDEVVKVFVGIVDYCCVGVEYCLVMCFELFVVDCDVFE